MTKLTRATVSAVTLLFIAGCRKTATTPPNYKAAIDTYYASRPVCLWQDEKKFPAQADTSNEDQTKGYDALVDQGLLTRTTAEKKVLIIASKQVNNYDLSSAGHSDWKADASQPGYGNFCVGTPKVTSIDSSTPATAQPGATTTVNYHVGISGPPAWATSPEMQTAFPQLAALLQTAPATATLTDTTNGWAVTQGPTGTMAHPPASSADGKVVE